VQLAGVQVEVSLALVEEVVVGDYVLIHVGFALQKIDPEETEATLALFAEVALMAQE
jgi:hydrogenase expression/formation protein HypC